MIILEPIIRLDHAGLSFVVLVLAGLTIALVVALPIVGAVNRRIGRAQAAPDLARALSRVSGLLLAERAARQDAETRSAEDRAALARLAAWAARGPELAAEPSDRQAHIVSMRRR